MKILWYVDKQFDTAPDTSTWLEIIKCLQQKHSVYLFCRYKYKKLLFEGIQHDFQYFKSSKISYLNRFVSYWDQVRKYEHIIAKHLPDIILFNTNNFFLIQKAIDAKNRYKHKLVLDIRSLDVSSNKVRKLLGDYFFKRVLESAAAFFDGITYITEEMEHYCSKVYNLPEHKSTVWTSGVNIDLFEPKRQNVNGNRHTLKLIYHGTVARNRGIQNVVRALSLFYRRDIHFSILGMGNGVPEITKLIKQHNLSEKVEILDPVSYTEVSSIVNQHDLGILPFPDWPAWNTSSPIKLFEYLACGIPVIATKIPAHINILKGKNFIFWADSDSPQDIAKTIETAYKKREHYANLGSEARKFILENYTWEKQAIKLEAFLKSFSQS